MSSPGSQSPKARGSRLTNGARGSAPALVPPVLIAVIVLLSSVGPLATDMYVPTFPMVATDLNAHASQVQLTLTAFFFGMGLGQVIGGPFSDQVGRRRPLLMGTVVTIVASVVCALAPNIWVMMVARLFQGFGGGWAVVVGRSVVVDLAQGPQLVRVMNVLMGAGAMAPVIAPLLGGLLFRFTGTWRTAFWVIAALAVVMTVAAARIVPESLPPERRHGGGFSAFITNARAVLSKRRFVGYMLVNSFSFMTLFAYVASSAFVLQVMNGVTPLLYSVIFAVNALGMMTATLISVRLAGRVETRRVIFTGQCLSLSAALLMLVGAVWFDMPLWFALVGFFSVMAAQGLIGPNGSALAAQQVPQLAGTASAVLGLSMSVAASIAPPIAGLGGSTNAVPMAALMVFGAMASMVSLLVIARPSRGQRQPA